MASPLHILFVYPVQPLPDGTLAVIAMVKAMAHDTPENPLVDPADLCAAKIVDLTPCVRELRVQS